MSEDWKGEALIRRRPTKAEQYSRGMSAVKSADAKRKQANGTNPGKVGTVWARRINASCIEAGVSWRAGSKE